MMGSHFEWIITYSALRNIVVSAGATINASLPAFRYHFTKWSKDVIEIQKKNFEQCVHTKKNTHTLRFP